jgi:hypothetical protein
MIGNFKYGCPYHAMVWMFFQHRLPTGLAQFLIELIRHSLQIHIAASK